MRICENISLFLEFGRKRRKVVFFFSVWRRLHLRNSCGTQTETKTILLFLNGFCGCSPAGTKNVLRDSINILIIKASSIKVQNSLLANHQELSRLCCLCTWNIRVCQYAKGFLIRSSSSESVWTLILRHFSFPKFHFFFLNSYLTLNLYIVVQLVLHLDYWW